MSHKLTVGKSLGSHGNMLHPECLERLVEHDDGERPKLIRFRPDPSSTMRGKDKVKGVPETDFVDGRLSTNKWWDPSKYEVVNEIEVVWGYDALPSYEQQRVRKAWKRVCEKSSPY